MASRAAPPIVEGATATNPQTGDKIVYRGGKWYPASSQQGVKLAPEDAKAMIDLAKEVQARQLLSQRASEFMKTQGRGESAIATGPALGDIPGLHFSPGKAALALRPGSASKIADLDAINNATWTALRPTGSGPIRNIEAKDWKKAFPNTSNWGESNGNIADRLNSEYADGLKQLQFVQSYIHSGKGGYGDALAAYTAAAAPPADPKAAKNEALKAKSASREPKLLGVEE